MPSLARAEACPRQRPADPARVRPRGSLRGAVLLGLCLLGLPPILLAQEALPAQTAPAQPAPAQPQQTAPAQPAPAQPGAPGAAPPRAPSRPSAAPSPLPPGSPGQAQTPNRIARIEFVGLVNTSQGELLANLKSRVGDPIDARLITNDIKTLFSLGFFLAVKAEAEDEPGRGFIVRFVVREKPRVVAVVLQGNSRLDDKELFKDMSVEVGSFYNKAFAESNAEKIRTAYRAKGYLTVKVTPQVEPIDEQNYRLTYRIEETPRQYITDIHIEGARVFNELELKRLMQSAEVDCFDWINDSGVFNEDKINQDLQIITARYLEQGYVRVFIDKPQVTLVRYPEYSKVLVRLHISEGAQYFAGKIDIAGDILGDKQRLLDAFGVKPGAVFNALLQNQDTFTLREIYQEQGYAFVNVQPDLRINDETKIVDVTYQIRRGDKAYIGRIDFQGNRETRDYVMRREFSVQENELYNGRKLRESQQRLSALGYFAPGSLNLDTAPRDVDNVLDVVTKVEESQTGTLQAQIGYSDQSGITVATSVSKGNFLGRGQTLRTSVQWSQRGVTRDISADFIEPHLIGTDYSSDSSVAYRTVQDQTELSRGNFSEVFASQGFGHPLVGPLRINFSLSSLNRTFDDPDETAVRLRTFTTALIYDTVNHPIFPSAGSNVTLALSQIGGELLRGTTEYRRYRLRLQRFVSLNDTGTLIAMGRVQMGWLDSVGTNAIPLEERFRIGGISSLRGYQFSEVGGPSGSLERLLNSVAVVQLDARGQPVLDSAGQPVLRAVDKRTLGLDEVTAGRLRGGGIQERLVNLELIFPLAGNNVRGVVFYDAGQVNAEHDQYVILGAEEPGFFDLLQSVGFGVRMITPLGVFRFEYGIKLKVRPNESPNQFDFTIGTLF